MEGRGWSKALLLWPPLPCRDPCVASMWQEARRGPVCFSHIPLLPGLRSVIKAGHTSWLWQGEEGGTWASYCGCGNVAFLKQTCGKAQGAMHQSKPVLSSHVCTQDVCTHVPASQLWAHLWGGRRHTEVSPSVSLVFLLDFHFVSENSWSCCVSFRCTAVIQLIYIYYFSNNFPLDYYRILNRVPCAL